jgi:hypothetical protein
MRKITEYLSFGLVEVFNFSIRKSVDVTANCKIGENQLRTL